MAIEERVVKAPEPPVEDILPDGDAPFKDSDEAAVEPEESTEEVSDEAQEIADEVKPGEEEVAGKQEIDEVDELLKEPEPEDKTGVQKRIDRLVAEKKALEERLAKVEQKSAVEDGKLPKYSEAQLNAALKKAFEEQDAQLAMEVYDYKVKAMKQELIEMYQGEKKQVEETSQRINAEWGETVNAYAKFADTKVPEIWSGSHKDLNLRDATSLLYQVAMALYWDNDPEKAKYYRGQPGGQKLAVADALARIQARKMGSKAKDSEKEKLKRQLTKERRKNAPIGKGAAGGETKTPTRNLSDTERLDEVIAERKKYQEERGV